jgi:hypothetical protein
VIATLALVSFNLAAAVVTLMQLFRVKERRLIPLLALFALTAAGHQRGAGDGWGLFLHFLAGGAGLVLLAMLLPRHPPATEAAPDKR